MRIVKTKNTKLNLIKELDLTIDSNSLFALIELGQEVEVDCINIVFGNDNIKNIKDLINKSGYYKTQKNHLIGKKDDEIHLIEMKDIVYIEGINNDTFVHTKKDEFIIKEKLYELELKLQDRLFARISKSYIISIYHIEKIKPTFNGKLNLILSSREQLEVSRHYIADFRKILGM